MKFSVFRPGAERATFPAPGMKAEPEVRRDTAPITVGAADPANRDLEGVGVVASS